MVPQSPSEFTLTAALHSSARNTVRTEKVLPMNRWTTALITAMLIGSLYLMAIDMQVCERTVDLDMDIGESFHSSTLEGSGYPDAADTRGKHWIPGLIDGGDVGAYTSLALDSTGAPHISFYNDSGKTLMYAHLEGDNWIKETADAQAGVGMWTSLVLDNSGRPHISYYDKTNGDLKYTYHNGANWQRETVNSTGNVGAGTSLALDGNGRPHIAFYDGGNGDLKYTRYDGAQWQSVTIDTYMDAGSYPSMELDSNDRPHISYLQDYTTHWLLGYAHFDGAQWNNGTADELHGVGIFSSIAVDGNDRPHIAYHGETPDSFLRYAHHNGADWEYKMVDQEDGVGRYTSIALDSHDLPHISYRDSNGQDLKYAYSDGTDWHSEIVESSGDVGRYSSLALDENDRAFVSYAKGWKDGLRFAFRDTVLPQIDSDLSPGFATTGDDYTFNITTSDDNAVSMVSVLWRHGLRSKNHSLSLSGGFWTATMRVGDHIDPLNYTIYVRDVAENLNASVQYQVEVRDNDPPQLVDDDSPHVSSTGGTFRFNVSVVDNVEVGAVKANWSHGALGGNLTLTSEGGYWAGTTTLDNNSISPMTYIIFMEDPSGQLSNTSQRNVTVTDVHGPVFGGLGHAAPPTTGDAFDLKVNVTDNIDVVSVEVRYKIDGRSGPNIVMTPVTAENESWNTTMAVPEDARMINCSFILSDREENTLTTDWNPIEVADDDPPVFVRDETKGLPTTGDAFDLTAVFTDNVAISGVDLSYSFDNETFVKAVMTGGADDGWTVKLNMTTDATELVYSYLAGDESHNIFTGALKALKVKDDDAPVPDAGSDAEYVEGDRVSLDGSASTDNIGIISYTWSFGYEGEMETLAGVNPFFELETAGLYNITLTVEDAAGSTSVDHVEIRMKDVTLPVLEATMDGMPIDSGSRFEARAGRPFRLDADGSTDNNEIVSYEWSFVEGGENKTLRGRVKDYTFISGGLYTITLTIADADGNTDTVTFDVNVKSAGGSGVSWGLMIIFIVIAVVILGGVVAVIIIVKKIKSGEGIRTEIIIEELPQPVYPDQFQQSTLPARYPVEGGGEVSAEFFDPATAPVVQSGDEPGIAPGIGANVEQVGEAVTEAVGQAPATAPVVQSGDEPGIAPGIGANVEQVGEAVTEAVGQAPATAPVVQSGDEPGIAPGIGANVEQVGEAVTEAVGQAPATAPVVQSGDEPGIAPGIGANVEQVGEAVTEAVGQAPATASVVQSGGEPGIAPGIGANVEQVGGVVTEAVGQTPGSTAQLQGDKPPSAR